MTDHTLISPFVLALDDDKGSLIAIQNVLTPKGYHVDSCQNYNDAVALLESNHYDALVVDLNLRSDKTGIDFLKVAQERHPNIPFVVVSGYIGEDLSGEFSNFLVESSTFLSIQLRKPGFERRLGQWADEFLQFIAYRQSARTGTYHSEDTRVNKLISEIIPTIATTPNLPVLILGESGTGKEDLARLIHESQHNPYRGGPFVAVNCAAISDTLILSELFGHVKNSFTGAEEHRLGWFLEASGWKHEPLSARKARQVIISDLLKHFGLNDINDLYQKLIMGGDFKSQKKAIDGFMTEINELIRKLGVSDDYVAWLRKNGNNVDYARKVIDMVDNEIKLMDSPYELTSDVYAEYLLVDNANPGTLFLDEIGDLSPAAEVALLRVLDGYGIRPLGYTGPALLPNCRIIAATNRIRSRADVRETFENRDTFGKMRKDLFYRLEGWIVELPALRDRKTVTGEYEWVISLNKWAAGDDLIFEEQGLDDFVTEYSKKKGNMLWDGNWRELRHVYSRAKAVAGMRSGNRTITKSDLDFASQWVIAEGGDETLGRNEKEGGSNESANLRNDTSQHPYGKVKEMFPLATNIDSAFKQLDRFEAVCKEMTDKKRISQEDIAQALEVTRPNVTGIIRNHRQVMLAFLREYPHFWPVMLDKTQILSWCSEKESAK